MPRIRTIKPEFWSDEKVMDLSMPARLFFIGLWNFADDNGVLEHKPKQIKARVFPGDLIDVVPLIQELIASGLVLAYEVDGQNYLLCKNLSKHQYIDSPRKSNLPIPPQSEIIRNHKISKEILSGREGKGREGKRKGKDGKGTLPPGGNGDSPPPAFTCPGFVISQDHFADLIRDNPQFPAEYLLTEFFPRMKAWCLDHRDDAKHRKKFDAVGRLKNPRSCFLKWLRAEDPGKAVGYRPRKIETSSTDPPGFATVYDHDCPACRGSGRDRDGPCQCGTLEPLLKPDPHCLLCGGAGLSKTGPCSCLHQEIQHGTTEPKNVSAKKPDNGQQCTTVTRIPAAS